MTLRIESIEGTLTSPSVINESANLFYLFLSPGMKGM